MRMRLCRTWPLHMEQNLGLSSGLAQLEQCDVWCDMLGCLIRFDGGAYSLLDRSTPPFVQFLTTLYASATASTEV